MWANPITLWRKGILGMNCRNVAYIGRYNPRERYPLVDDKLLTKLVVRKAGVTAPELLLVIRLQHEIEHIEQILAKFTQFVIKPARGSGGKGILVIVGHDGDNLVKSSGSQLSVADVKRHLSNIISGLYSLGGRTDVAFVEALVTTDATFEDISYEGVPDIRLIVFKGYPVMGMLRLATKESDGKANLHQGAVGVGIDIASGRSIAAVQFNRPIDCHPDTGHSLSGIEVPHWRQLLSLAARCYEVTRLGYLGADMVLDVDPRSAAAGAERAARTHHSGRERPRLAAAPATRRIARRTTALHGRRARRLLDRTLRTRHRRVAAVVVGHCRFSRNHHLRLTDPMRGHTMRGART